MNYLFLPLDQHFDLGFGAVADSFKESADALAKSNLLSPSLNMHLPISFLYRHAIELYLKSAILIFHRKFRTASPRGSEHPEPKVLVGTKWKPIYVVHEVGALYRNLRSYFSDQKAYLDANTRTDWTFPEELDAWIAEIEAADSSSTFFRYPVTRDTTRDKEKSVIKEDDYNCRISRNGPTRFPLIGPTLDGLPAEPQARSFTCPFCAKQVSWL